MHLYLVSLPRLLQGQQALRHMMGRLKGPIQAQWIGHMHAQGRGVAHIQHTKGLKASSCWESCCQPPQLNSGSICANQAEPLLNAISCACSQVNSGLDIQAQHSAGQNHYGMAQQSGKARDADTEA